MNRALTHWHVALWFSPQPTVRYVRTYTIKARTALAAIKRGQFRAHVEPRSKRGNLVRAEAAQIIAPTAKELAWLKPLKKARHAKRKTRTARAQRRG